MANLLFKPVPSTTIGLEYSFGVFTVHDGRRGSASRLQVAMQIDLVR